MQEELSVSVSGLHPVDDGLMALQSVTRKVNMIKFEASCLLCEFLHMLTKQTLTSAIIKNTVLTCLYFAFISIFLNSACNILRLFIYIKTCDVHV